MARKTTYLRCALFWERALLEERIFPPASRVTVGESPRATFTLEGAGLNRRHCLLQHTSRGTLLFLRPGMVGRLRLGGQVKEAEELAGGDAVAERQGDAYRYVLGEGDEGVLVFGRVGLSFSLVSDLGRALPARVGEVLDGDPFTAKMFGVVLAVFLLVALFSRLFAGSRPEFTIEHLPERMVSFMVEDPEAARELKEELKKISEEEIKKREAEKNKQTAPQKIPKDREPPKNAEQERLRKKVADKGLVGAISTARKKKGALQDVLDDGGLGINLNTAVHQLERGLATARVLTSTGEGGIQLPNLVSRRGSAAADGEGLERDLPATGRAGRRAGRESRLRERAESAVIVSMPTSEATLTGGTLSRQEISDVVMRNKGAIRYCYESQLMRYPTLRGKVVVEFIIDTGGQVSNVKISQNTLSQAAARAQVASCLIKFISRWRFPKPRGGKVRVIYPFTFGRTQ